MSDLITLTAKDIESRENEEGIFIVTFKNKQNKEVRGKVISFNTHGEYKIELIKDEL